MFRFQDPQYLPLLSLIIILALLYVFNAYKVRHLEKQLADKRLLSETAPKRSPKRRLLKFVLLETALAFFGIDDGASSIWHQQHPRERARN
jgi:hypothetical protein